MEILSTFDAYSVYTMEIGICNKKNQWRYSIWIETPSLIKYKNVIENRSQYAEDEYRKIINEMKSLIKDIKSTLVVEDINGENMILPMIDENQL